MAIVKQCKNGNDTCVAKQSNIGYQTVEPATIENTYIFYCPDSFAACYYEKVSVYLSQIASSSPDLSGTINLIVCPDDQTTCPESNAVVAAFDSSGHITESDYFIKVCASGVCQYQQANTLISSSFDYEQIRQDWLALDEAMVSFVFLGVLSIYVTGWSLGIIARQLRSLR